MSATAPTTAAPNTPTPSHNPPTLLTFATAAFPDAAALLAALVAALAALAATLPLVEMLAEDRAVDRAVPEGPLEAGAEVGEDIIEAVEDADMDEAEEEDMEDMEDMLVELAPPPAEEEAHVAAVGRAVTPTGLQIPSGEGGRNVSKVGLSFGLGGTLA